MSDKPKTFVFTVEYEQTFTVDEIWPDGDAPENPTTTDVLKVVAQCGGALQVICDWNLDNDLTLAVDGEVAS